MNLDNNKMKFFICTFLLLILLAVPLSFAAGGSYSLPNAKETIVVNDNATVHISDEITYSITGSVNGVTKIVPLSGQQSITDISVETPGYYNTVEVEQTNRLVTIKVWLYKDAQKTQKVSDEDVNVIYQYNFNKGVKIYNDIAEFQYMSWGNGWDQQVDKLTTIIEIPGTQHETEYWNNPDTYVEKSSWTSDNTLTTTYKNIPAKTSAEQRILMPKSYFTTTQYADVINKDAKSQIEQDQIKYAGQTAFDNNIWSLPAIISAILMILPVGMFLRWGRDPKIIYSADYESQIPTDDSPVFVNAMIPGIIEDLNEDAFTATLLDLVDKKYYKMIVSNEEDTILRRTDKDTSTLKLHEKDIIDFLKDFENDKQQISLKNIGEDSYTVQKFVHAWKIDAMRDVPVSKVNQYYDKSKENMMSGYNILAIFVGVVLLFASLMWGKGPWLMIGMILSVLLIVEQIVIFLFVDTPLGRWTPDGKVFHDKWKNFEKYIKDFSLIKENPPASIQVWGRFLVYATALGCADEVSRNMKKFMEFRNLPENIIYDSDVVSLGYLWGFHHMRSTFIPMGMANTGLENTNFDTGSFGDIGGPGSGGFGGGGGGVF